MNNKLAIAQMIRQLQENHSDKVASARKLASFLKKPSMFPHTNNHQLRMD